MTHIRKLAGSAAYRRQTGECLCDSPKLLREAAQWGADVRTVVSVLPWDGPLPDHVRQVLVPPEVMSSISPAKTPQGVLFTCAIPVLPVPETLPGRRYVVLDGVQDPGNVGTVLRTLDAFDADGLLLTGGCADTAAAMAAFSDSQRGDMGMSTVLSHRSSTSRLRPRPSEPMARAHRE